MKHIHLWGGMYVHPAHGAACMHMQMWLIRRAVSKGWAAVCACSCVGSCWLRSRPPFVAGSGTAPGTAQLCASLSVPKASVS